ncbi:MAG: YeeE/YedE family protein [Deltaproteobacteria bacterium]|nr:YeeE/YedE family protein [Deltaproteobacteria bacterium]MBN2671331.1 YeeE/YedE family protein [Deltaproteobacteria bacterium]
MMNLLQLVLGALFGLILFKGELAGQPKIRAMFHFEEPDLFLVIASAVVVGLVSLQLLKSVERRSNGKKRFSYPKKEMTKGVIIGGFLFGVGWYITGACPGPIAVQIGSGAWPALLTLLGAVLGTYAYARLRHRLPH